MLNIAHYKRNANHNTTMRYYLTLVRIVIIKKSTMRVGKGVEKRKPSYPAGGNVI